MDLAGKRVTVAGLGRFGGGIAVSQWLVQQGARVLVTDQAEADTLAASVKQLDGLPIDFRLGEHREEDFTTPNLVVASPAIPRTNPFLQAAKDANVPVTTEIKLFIERCPAKILGVTGTKGKSTTSAMLAEMLRQRYTVHLGGNIGRSLLFELPRIQPGDLIVLELSSFMLDYLGEMRWSPHVGLITMIAADHIQWHGSLGAYVDAKKNLVRFQQLDDIAVLNASDPASKELISQAAGRVILFGMDSAPTFSLKIPGRHNQLNAQAAFAAAHLLGIEWEQAQSALKDFLGLPHRLQLVHEENGVRYFNDSIATIPEAAIAALETFPPKTVIQIVGGHDKGLSLTAMCAALVERAKAVLCIGATGPSIASQMGQTPYLGAASVYQCGDLKAALALARQMARPGDVILLSPGCASYGQFTNFEERGQRFAKLARGEI